ncbi:hypothetical protein ACWDYH_28430 [Nocardia goodfellowii]
MEFQLAVTASADSHRYSIIVEPGFDTGGKPLDRPLRETLERIFYADSSYAPVDDRSENA